MSFEKDAGLPPKLLGMPAEAVREGLSQMGVQRAVAQTAKHPLLGGMQEAAQRMAANPFRPPAKIAPPPIEMFHAPSAAPAAAASSAAKATSAAAPATATAPTLSALPMSSVAPAPVAAGGAAPLAKTQLSAAPRQAPKQWVAPTEEEAAQRLSEAKAMGLLGGKWGDKPKVLERAMAEAGITPHASAPLPASPVSGPATPGGTRRFTVPVQ